MLASAGRGWKPRSPVTVGFWARGLAARQPDSPRPGRGRPVCAVCGQPEEPNEVPGVVGQILGGQEDASL